MKNNKIKTHLSDGSINPEYLEMLQRKTLIESTGASLRLSGRKISDEQVAEILTKIEE
jgi:UDP-N-acetyl-D-mannosaminuronic acid transferase (WecB/TagA/CpsF family)